MLRLYFPLTLWADTKNLTQPARVTKNLAFMGYTYMHTHVYIYTHNLIYE